MRAGVHRRHGYVAPAANYMTGTAADTDVSSL